MKLIDISDKQEKFDILRELLISENDKYNLTRITEPVDIENRHFQDSLAVLKLIKNTTFEDDYKPSLIDIGSGAGFPSLALAIMMDDWTFVSAEATGKKADFQMKAANAIGLKNFTAINARAEEIGNSSQYRGKFDFATARALGHLALIIELAVPLLKVDGTFFAWKGQKASEEIRQSEKTFKLLKCSLTDNMNYSLPDEESDLRILAIQKNQDTPTTYPRAYNIIKKTVSRIKEL